jgi:hypothetical protein
LSKLIRRSGSLHQIVTGVPNHFCKPKPVLKDIESNYARLM